MNERKLAETFTAAMQIWDAMKAEGQPIQVRVATLTQTLRQAWPFTREWHYLCSNCDDTGLSMGVCSGDATCGRHKLHLAHDYGTPCWCKAGARFKDRPKPTMDDFAAAGKIKRQPTKLGR